MIMDSKLSETLEQLGKIFDELHIQLCMGVETVGVVGLGQILDNMLKTLELMEKISGIVLARKTE